MSESLPRAVSKDERELIDLVEWLSRGQDIHAGDDHFTVNSKDIVESYNRNTVNSRDETLGGIDVAKAVRFLDWLAEGEVLEFKDDSWGDSFVEFTGTSPLIHHLVCVQYPRDVANGEA